MKLSKFISIVGLFTCISLLYVYQQSEIFRLAYTGQKHLTVFQELLDKNTVLKYNIEKNASLIRIGNKIYEGADFQMPDSYQLVRLERSLENLKNEGLPKKENIVSRIFGVRSQAEARTINP